MNRAALSLLLLCIGTAAGADSLRDPTLPADPSTFRNPDDFGSWQLNSTLVSPQRREAVINGVRVTVGARLDKVQVVAIEHGTVCLRNSAGRTFTLHLVPDNGKTLIKTRSRTQP